MARQMAQEGKDLMGGVPTQEQLPSTPVVLGTTATVLCFTAP